MKKWFIADVLTVLKIVPTVCILYFCRRIDSGLVFVLFGAGEVLDALDGMAAKKWPHPAEVEKTWFRRHIKLIESGLDLLLAVATLFYIMLRIDFLTGCAILLIATLLGVILELMLYGKLFGTPSTAKAGSLFMTNPEKATSIVGCRLLGYLACLVAIIAVLIWNAPWNVTVKIVVIVGCALVGCLVAIKKLQDGRLDDVLHFLGIK